MRNSLFILLVFFAAALPVKADQPTVTAQPTAQLGARRAAQKNPYARLFEARDALTQAQQQVPQDAAKRTTVCGLTIIEADPLFDAKMRVTPKDAGVRYTIRAVDPPVCQQARK